MVAYGDGALVGAKDKGALVDVGKKLGEALDGIIVGKMEGAFVFTTVGVLVAKTVGACVGVAVLGAPVFPLDTEGNRVGATVGFALVGDNVGVCEGSALGFCEGIKLGVLVRHTVAPIDTTLGHARQEEDPALGW